MPLPRPSAQQVGRVAWNAVQLLAATHMVATHIIDVRLTMGTSMVPTLSPTGDLVACIKFPVYSFMRSIRSLFTPTDPTLQAQEAYDAKVRNKHHLELGDMVVAVSPTNPGRAVCKRVLGLPGDTLQADPRDEKSPFVMVPRGHVWLGGDNINNSTDSRHYGSVPMGLVQGRVVARVCLPCPFPSFQSSLTRLLATDTGSCRCYPLQFLGTTSRLHQYHDPALLLSLCPSRAYLFVHAYQIDLLILIAPKQRTNLCFVLGCSVGIRVERKSRWSSRIGIPADQSTEVQVVHNFFDPLDIVLHKDRRVSFHAQSI